MRSNLFIVPVYVTNPPLLSHLPVEVKEFWDQPAVSGLSDEGIYLLAAGIVQKENVRLQSAWAAPQLRQN